MITLDQYPESRIYKERLQIRTKKTTEWNIFKRLEQTLQKRISKWSTSIGKVTQDHYMNDT